MPVRFSHKSGLISPLEIIPAKHFPQTRINLSDRNHPFETFSANQDHFPRRKSSLPDISCESGSISPTGIIPLRLFPQIRINLPAGNHPCQAFPVNQDQFTRRKSSLQKLFIKSGSISPTKIIPPRYFYQIRITPPPKMHPQPRFQANQDNSLTKSPGPNASPTTRKSSRTSFFSNHQLLIIQQLISHQAFSFPGLIRSNVQKLRDRRSNVLYAYILKLFAGFKIFSLDDKRYGHILRRIRAVRSVMTAVVRGNYDRKIIRKGVHNPVPFRQPELIKLYTSLRQNPQRRFYRMRQRRCCSLNAAEAGVSAPMLQFEGGISLSPSSSIPQLKKQISRSVRSRDPFFATNL